MPIRSRRQFLFDLGRATLAVAVLAACDESSAPLAVEDSPAERWERIAMANVSAYLVVRDGQVALIDTGLSGSADAIRAGLDTVGLDFSAVSDVILTHAHPDHAGSIAAVLDLAEGATGYIGAADLSAVGADVSLTALEGGETIMGLDVIATPGHTPGHISLLDSSLDVLFAGDALIGADGAVVGPDARFTDDMGEANRSLAVLAGLSFDTIAFGHGDPVSPDASGQVAELVAVR